MSDDGVWSDYVFAFKARVAAEARERSAQARERAEDEERKRNRKVGAMSTRDELIADLSREEHAPMSDHDPRDGSCRSCPWPTYMLGPSDIADALIAEGWRKKPSRDEVARALSLAMAENPYTWEEVPTEMCPDDRDGTTKLVKTLHLNPLVEAVLALMDRGQ